MYSMASYLTMNGLQNGGTKGVTKTQKMKTLENIHWYLRIIVVLNAMFVLAVVSSMLVTYYSLRHYDAVSKENINAIVTNIVGITQNANTATAFAVPIASDFAFTTNQLSGALGKMLNSTNTTISLDDSAASVSVSERRLMHYDEQDITDFTVNTQREIFKLTRNLLQAATEKMDTFNPKAMSDFLSFIVDGTNFTGIASRFDRIMTDVEKTAHFGVLASSMLGLAAVATNTTLPSPSDLMSSYSAQRAAAAPPSGGACH
jgi:hypothetical protein